MVPEMFYGIQIGTLSWPIESMLFFKEEHTFSWPAQSPDLNPIEHLWHHLKLRLSLDEDRDKGLHDLWSRIEKECISCTKE